MKIIVIPPYKYTSYRPEEGRFLAKELSEKMRARGQLDGVQLDFDTGYEVKDESNKIRDEEFLAKITIGTIIKTKEYCEKGGYDAIVHLGTMGMGFAASRMLARIPVVTAVWAGLHVASLLGERFSLIEANDAQALIARHNAMLYGLSDKLISIRGINRTSTDLTRFLHQYKKDERINAPEIKQVVQDIVQQCIVAVEKDRVDTLILGCTPLQGYEDEVRQELDSKGYDEIPIVCEFSAAIELAKAMVNLRLAQAPRAYPGHSLKSKPEFR